MTCFEDVTTTWPEAMTNGAMVEAPMILLGRAPASPGAHVLTEHVTASILPCLVMGEGKPIGSKALPKWKADVGNVLAGMMRPSERVVSVQRGKGIGVWAGGGNGIGHQRFWRILDAMKAAGLAWDRKGTQSNARHEPNGYPTRIGPTTRLLDEAQSRGVTLDTRKADWRLDPLHQAKPGALSDGGVAAVAWRGVEPSGVDEHERAALVATLADLNALNARSVILGAGHTVTLWRLFHVNLSLGGRHYGPTYLNASVDERLSITINGEAVAEVDLKAAQLSIAAGLAGMAGADGSLPFGDPYAFPGLHRKAVKAWATRTLGRGGAAFWRDHECAWDVADAAEVQSTDFHAVRAAMVERFPLLSDLRTLVPPGVLNGLPGKLQGKAAGLYLMMKEATIITRAMAHCVALGVPVLPVHDAVLVPVSKVKVAVDGVEAAARAVAGMVPRWELETARRNPSLRP